MIQAVIYFFVCLVALRLVSEFPNDKKAGITSVVIILLAWATLIVPEFSK